MDTTLEHGREPEGEDDLPKPSRRNLIKAAGVTAAGAVAWAAAQAGPAAAGNGDGQTFDLGETNSAASETSLSRSATATPDGSAVLRVAVDTPGEASAIVGEVQPPSGGPGDFAYGVRGETLDGFSSEFPPLGDPDADTSPPLVAGVLGRAHSDHTDFPVAGVAGVGLGLNGTDAIGVEGKAASRSTGFDPPGEAIGVRGTVDESMSQGVGVEGSARARGVRGTAGVDGVGVEGIGDPLGSGTGVKGVAPVIGVDGTADRSGLGPEYSAGVRGTHEDDGAGVAGSSMSGPAIYARSVAGHGVDAANDDADAPAVKASNPSGTGLHGEGMDGVNGKGADRGVHGEGKDGVHGKSDQAGGRGIHGEAKHDDPTSKAMHGEHNDPDGTAIHGEGGMHGVHGQASHGSGAGLKGENSNGKGVHGEGKDGVHGKGTERGVHGKSDEANGRGIHGEAHGASGKGIHGQSNDENGHGVHGENGHANGTGVKGNGGMRGVHGEGKDGVHGKGTERGVHGKSEAADGRGIHGEASGANGKGVHGEGKTGVHGKSDHVGTQADPGMGIAGEASGANGVGVKGTGASFGVHGHTENRQGAGVKGTNGGGGGGGAAALSALERRARDGRRRVAARSTSLTRSHEAGHADPAVGVFGLSEIGIQAVGTEAALVVQGPACFDTVGESGKAIYPGGPIVPSVSVGKASVTVQDPRVASDTFVSVVLTSDPGNSTTGRSAISWISRPGTGSFTINLTQKVGKATTFSYFLVSPC